MEFSNVVKPKQTLELSPFFAAYNHVIAFCEGFFILDIYATCIIHLFYAQLLFIELYNSHKLSFALVLQVLDLAWVGVFSFFP
jgi:hypothetical protein